MNDQAKERNDAYARPHYYTFIKPEPSGWKCELFGVNGGVMLYPAKGNVPNWFWRWTQRICFGNKWSRV